MHDQRPDPDALLTRVQAEEAQQARGTLKIFFGATAGVGKTYAMLDAAHARARNIAKIVIGKPERPRWKDLLLGSVADDLLRKSGVIDVYVLSGDFGDSEPPLRQQLRPASPWP